MKIEKFILASALGLIFLAGKSSQATLPGYCNFILTDPDLKKEALLLKQSRGTSDDVVGGLVKFFVSDSSFWGVRDDIASNSWGMALSDAQLIEAIENPDRRQNFEKALRNYNVSPWALDWISDKSFRRAGYDLTLENGLQFIKTPTKQQDPEAKVIEILSLQSRPLSKDAMEDIRAAVMQGYGGNAEQKEAVEVDTALDRSLAVFPDAIWSTPGAEEALKRVREIMGQKGGDVLAKETADLLTDNRYQEPIRKLALKMIQMVADTNELPRGNFYNDLLKAFLDESYDQQTAETLAWETIAVMAKGGANTVLRMATYNGRQKNENRNEGVELGLSVIASVLPVLDERTSLTGHIYSYPSNVTSHADTGKMYHFWMAAYLARRLRIENFGARASMAAAYAAEMGYQFLSRSVGRDPERTLWSDLYSGTNNVMRTDLTYAAAGANFGAGARQKSLNVDRGLQTAIKNAKGSNVTPDKSKALFKSDIPRAFLFWAERFAPYSIFHHFDGIL